MSIRSALLALLTIASTVRADGDARKISYEKDVLPILQARCYSCHDESKQRAGLRLDVRSNALKKVIVPGDANAGELIRRITHADKAERMPRNEEPLSKKEIAAIRAWINDGANWPDSLANEIETHKHWAFNAPIRPTVPKLTEHPIDAFVRAELKKEGLQPAAEADRVTLIRRLYLDLIGLPPSPEEVDAFVRNKSADAYAKLVEKLLASKHYGERWGRIWLDAARYADSDGYEKDKPRYVWFYRDWVINALNRDLPYDKFIVEQIAGDLLPNATQDQIVATGYLRNSMLNEEGGIDPEQFRMEAMFDRVDAIGKGVLGLTIQCAQCHTHKYDPISHNEYYEFFAFLNNADEAHATVYTSDEQRRRTEVLRRIQAIESQLKHELPDWKTRMHAWEDIQREKLTEWTIIKPTNLDGSGGEKNDLLENGSILASGYAPSKAVNTYNFTVDRPVSAIRLEVMNDPTLPRGGPGRSVPFGSFALTEFTVKAHPVDGSDKAMSVKIATATADSEPQRRPLAKQFDYEQKKKRYTGPAAYAIDDDPLTGWTTDLGPGRGNQPHHAVFTLEKPIDFGKPTEITIELVQKHGGDNSNNNESNNLGRFRFSMTDAVNPTAEPFPLEVRRIIEQGYENRTPVEDALVFHHWRKTIPIWDAANKAIENAWAKHPVGSTQQVLQPRDDGRMTRRLDRGDFLKPAETVQPSVPKFLHPLPKGAAANRLGFAQWLVDRKSPTTARSFVNRIWQSYFGIGLVETPEDFGTQGALPSHPELLDWLAVEFMQPTDNGLSVKAKPWSIKHLHRLIVTSATYKQRSDVTPELAERDPHNRLLARGPRYRVDAEVVRDIALSASGLLTEKVGGPSVYPPVPKFLMEAPASYGNKNWPTDTDADRYRRSLYVFAFRSVPYPPLQAFDATPGDVACVRRTRSNTPLQALTTLNEPIFVESARALAQRALQQKGNDAAKLSFAFRCCVARKPSDNELSLLQKFLTKQRKQYQSADAKAMLGTFQYDVPAAEAAAWVAVARVMLNLDETISKE